MRTAEVVPPSERQAVKSIIIDLLMTIAGSNEPIHIQLTAVCAALVTLAESCTAGSTAEAMGELELQLVSTIEAWIKSNGGGPAYSN